MNINNIIRLSSEGKTELLFQEQLFKAKEFEDIMMWNKVFSKDSFLLSRLQASLYLNVSFFYIKQLD